MKNWTWGKFFWGEKEPIEKFEQINVSTPGPAEPDFNSPTWIYLKQLIEERIAELRRDNDSLKKTEIQTAHIRGKISILKDLLDTPSRESRLNTIHLNAGD